MRDRIMGVIETPAVLAGGLASSVATPAVQLFHEMTGGRAFTPEGKAAAKQYADQVPQQFYQPRTQTSRNIVGAIGNATEGLVGVPMGTLNMLGQTAPAGLRAATDVTRAQAQPALNALASARQGVGTGAANLSSSLAGTIMGKPAESVRQAYAAGKAGNADFLENLRGNVPADQILGDIKQGIATIQTDASKAYTNAKTGWAADKTPLDFTPIDKKLADVKSSLEVNGKSKIGEAEQRVIKEIDDVVAQWKNDPAARTALDLDALKQRIDAIYPESPRHTQAQRAVTDIRNTVKDTITSQVPEYTDAMKAYETQLGLVRDITKALGTSDKIAKETAINKIMSVLKGTPSSQFKQDLVEQLKKQGGVDIMPALAGQDLSSWLPTSGIGKSIMGGGLTAATLLHHPELALATPLTMPRLMGEAYYGMGRLSGAGGRGASAVSNALASNLTPAQAQQLNMLMLQTGQRQPNQLGNQ